MCNHEYTADYSQMGGLVGHRCPYPELYQKLRANAALTDDEREKLELPLDSSGVCIFHSKDLEWKQEHDFCDWFSKALELLTAGEEMAHYDFAEFVFVGQGPRPQNGKRNQVFSIRNRTFPKQVCFKGASFLHEVELDGLEFLHDVSFGQATFGQDLRVKNTTFRGMDFIRANVQQRASFSGVQSKSYALFTHAHFIGHSKGREVMFENSLFRGITDFTEVKFSHGGESTVKFLHVAFEDVVDFSRASFQGHAVFEEVSFAALTEFVDTSFEMVTSAARYRGAAVEFNQIEVKPEALLTFKSSNSQAKMFDHDVQMSFRGEPEGIIRFENVNFNKLTPASRERLMRLTRSGRVEIGPGCIKYRHQTDIRSIPMTSGNAPLVIELCQTFANYFTVSNGISLGFEIVERERSRVSFFYFTDEDIEEVDFLGRLKQAEQGLWSLLSIQSTGQLVALQPTSTAAPTPGENTIINAIDGISALIGTFFRVGARIALGSWQMEDTRALLNVIRFNDQGADERALSLHGVIVENYTGRVLFGINSKQNDPLLPLLAGDQRLLPPEKVRILFLGANSLESPLALGEEVKRIHANLKLAKERDNLELKQEWAVTVDSLMQAMLDESPTIVHFSGHGEDSGIILQDEMGRPKLVTAEALASLFKLFKDRVKCVVLNSCYSERQARAIRLHVPYVIGMTSRVPDSVSVLFSTGFYKGIGAGRDVPFAFKLGTLAVQMEGLAGEDIPVLL